MLIPALAFFWAFGGGILGLLILALWIMGLIDVTRRSDLDRGARTRWIALIVLLPLAGTLIYLGKRPTLPEERDKIVAAQTRHRT
jgi:Phospholipase_D-nuclease N-terminal